MCFPSRKRAARTAKASDVPIRPAGAENNSYWRERIAAEKEKEADRKSVHSITAKSVSAGLPDGVKSSSAASQHSISNATTIVPSRPTSSPPPPPPTPYVSTTSIRDPGLANPAVAPITNDASKTGVTTNGRANSTGTSQRATLKKRNPSNARNGYPWKSAPKITEKKENETMIR